MKSYIYIIRSYAQNMQNKILDLLYTYNTEPLLSSRKNAQPLLRTHILWFYTFKISVSLTGLFKKLDGPKIVDLLLALRPRHRHCLEG